MIKLDIHIFKGMTKDLSKSKFSNEFLFDTLNIRITTRDKETLLTITNERGTKEVSIVDNKLRSVPIEGTLLGYSIINDIVILFTKGDKDYIYKLILNNNTFILSTLFSGNLNFNLDYPIETLNVYENENILKVYWVDGLNQPRVINISKTYTDASIFDFKKPAEIPVITINKNSNGGVFPSGTILYAFNYYNLYGQQSPILNISSMYYLSSGNLGNSPEETVNNSFDITIEKADINFDFIRIYSIIRTSIDAVPIVKRVTDLNIPKDKSTKKIHILEYRDPILIPKFEFLSVQDSDIYVIENNCTFKLLKDFKLSDGSYVIPYGIHILTSKNGGNGIAVFSVGNLRITATKNTQGFLYTAEQNPNYVVTKYDNIVFNEILEAAPIKYIDTGNTGDLIDPTELLYVGGDVISAETLCLKDETLFLGNIKLLLKNLKELKNLSRELKIENSYKNVYDSSINRTGTYPWKSLLNNPSSNIKTFKSREWYRLGFRGIDKYGKKSEVIWIKDHYNENAPSHTIISNELPLPIFYCEIPKQFKQKLIDLGYTKIEPMIVYPSESDRECVCQGLVCPTVYNTLDRASNSPFVLSSWFTRLFPIINLDIGSENQYYDNNKDINKGAWYEFRHNLALHNSINRGAEIQCNYYTPLSSKGLYQLSSLATESEYIKFINDAKNDYHIDSNIVSFYSPEIEFEELYNLDSLDLSFRIVAVTLLSGTTTSVNLTTSTPSVDNKGIGFVNPNIVNTEYNLYSFRSLGAYPMWVDRIAKSKKPTLAGFMIYPWQRSGSLTNYGSLKEGDNIKPALLKHKRMSVLRFFNKNIYLNTPWIPTLGITPVSIFNSNELTNIKIPSPKNSELESLNYYGNCDKILTTPSIEGYPIMITKPVVSEEEIKKYNLGALLESPLLSLTADITDDINSFDPISIKYKSGTHAVFAFNFTGRNKPVILPFIKGMTLNIGDGVEGYVPFWDRKGGTLQVQKSEISDDSLLYLPNSAYMYIGELYRKEVKNRFGGNSDSAIENNLWTIAGPILDLERPSTPYTSLLFVEGDTFYQRYDALKTYAFSNEDTNNIVDIPSFMCETRVNLDGRYDNNRGNIDNTYINKTNFNLLNKVYSLKNNFFTGRALNYNKELTDKYNNVIIWSKLKILGEEIDTWTDVSLASALSLDGDKGEITSLNTYNNEIFCFLKTGLSLILFNNRVLIPTSEGVPIEISNNNKVDGKRYVSNTIGCNNKYSICETSNGLYFIDNITNSIYLFNGLINSISDKLGFRQWLGKYNNMDKWTPNNNNFKTYYDSNNDDLYFVTKDTCLCYSLLLGLFTSFMSYEDTPAMFNLQSKFFSFKNNNIWKMFEGDYNMFYGEYKPYSITLISNPEEPYDKIFDTIEFRADMWNKNNLLLNTTFDTLDVWNEYLYGKSSLINTKNKSSSLKKKFRVWRANIPRANTDWNGIKANGRDRIRNTWAYIKLSTNNNNTNMMELHDVIVNYSI